MRSLVVIADDTEVIRSLRVALRSSAQCRVAATVDGRYSVRARLSEVRPDIVLVDAMCKRTNAFARLRDVREAAPAAKAVLLYDGTDARLIGDALASGAHAVLSRRLHPSTFGVLLGAVAEGAVAHLQVAYPQSAPASARTSA